jgi:hypothetical protein
MKLRINRPTCADKASNSDRFCYFYLGFCYLFCYLFNEYTSYIITLYKFVNNVGSFQELDKPNLLTSRSQWPRGLRRRFAAAWLLGSRVRIQLQASMIVYHSSLITRPEESYRVSNCV